MRHDSCVVEPTRHVVDDQERICVLLAFPFTLNLCLFIFLYDSLLLVCSVKNQL